MNIVAKDNGFEIENNEVKDITKFLDNLDVRDDKSNIIKDYDKAYLNLSKKYQGRELDYKIRNKLLSKGYDYQTIENLFHEKKA